MHADVSSLLLSVAIFSLTVPQLILLFSSSLPALPSVFLEAFTKCPSLTAEASSHQSLGNRRQGGWLGDTGESSLSYPKKYA